MLIIQIDAVEGGNPGEPDYRVADHILFRAIIGENMFYSQYYRTFADLNGEIRPLVDTLKKNQSVVILTDRAKKWKERLG